MHVIETTEAFFVQEDSIAVLNQYSYEPIYML